MVNPKMRVNSHNTRFNPQRMAKVMPKLRIYSLISLNNQSPKTDERPGDTAVCRIEGFVAGTSDDRKDCYDRKTRINVAFY